MKLYYSPGACSLAPHIALRETGADFDIEKVDLGTKTTEAGEDFAAVNPKGYVPALKLDSGEVLTEVAVVLQYIADQRPDGGLSPKAGTMERYRLLEALNFVSSEIHKSIGALFNPAVTPEWREAQLGLIAKRLDFLTGKIGGNPYLLGDEFSIADAYLFTVLNWTNILDIDISKWPLLTDYMGRVAARPGTQAAMKAEGLLG